MPGVSAARARYGESYWRNAKTLMDMLHESTQARGELGNKNAERKSKAGIDAKTATTQVRSAEREHQIQIISLLFTLLGTVLSLVELVGNLTEDAPADGQGMGDYLKRNNSALQAFLQSLTALFQQIGQLMVKEAEIAKAKKDLASAEGVLQSV